MTGWIVATIGLKFKIEALAMPLIGLGALLRLSGQGQRASAFGTALAGFGLLFLGIALLQQTFGRRWKRWRSWTRPSTGSWSACADRP